MDSNTESAGMCKILKWNKSIKQLGLHNTEELKWVAGWMTGYGHQSPEPYIGRMASGKRVGDQNGNCPKWNMHKSQNN